MAIITLQKHRYTRIFLTSIILNISFSALVFSQETNNVMHSSKIVWQALNPARGELGPKAGVLWGDLKSEDATGFLAQFSDGFVSPPHIHRATYRAVVMHGLIHNAHPDNKFMWMPLGSFWTQPKGGNHITAAKKGSKAMALVEIDKGPYVVLPSEDTFESHERAINIHESNVVWVTPQDLDLPAKDLKIAYLSGAFEDGSSNSSFIKIPEYHTIYLKTNSTVFHAVIIKGEIEYGNNKILLDEGSYFNSSNEFSHQISSLGEQNVVIYIRTNSRYYLKIK